MDLPSDLLARTPQEGAHRIALAFLDEARAQAPRLKDAQDEEALHDVRVAIRRLRSTLRAWHGELRGSLTKRHRRALGDLQGTTGAGRDAEVGLLWLQRQRKRLEPGERAGVRLLIGRLTERHAAAMKGARGELLRAFAKLQRTLRRRLATATVPVADTGGARTFVGACAAKLREHAAALRDHLLAVAGVDDREQAHATRIRSKRLRYLLEPLQGHVAGAADVVARCKGLQDVLGDLNDAHVMLDELAQVRGGQEEWEGLQEIGRRAQARCEKLHARFVRDWQPKGLDALLGAVEEVARACEAAARPAQEIERKYLLSGLPPAMPAGRVQEIEQGWLPGEAVRERIRRLREGKQVRHVRTIKLGRGLTRTEVEEEASAEVFAALWPLTKGCRVHKQRTVVEEDGHAFEIDAFLDRNLVLAEVELSRPDEDVALPAWLQAVLVREVTDEPGYTNLELAR